jgi:hypothetical protein
VDQDGEFHLTFPEEYLDVAYALWQQKPWNLKTINITRPRENYRVSGKILSVCEDFLKAVLLDYHRPEVSERLVIIYGISTRLAFWENPDGTLAPNGYVGEKGGYWAKLPDGLNATRENHYTLGIGAWVRREVTYRRKSGSVDVRFENTGNHLGADSIIDRLNAFTGLSCPAQPAEGSFTVIPYSEASAKFFYDSLMALCTIARNLRGMMSDERVRAALEAGTMTSFAPLGAPTLSCVEAPTS